MKEASAKGYAIIARMPLQFGLLTGKFDNGVSFDENDHRKKRIVPEIISASGEALAPVWELCRKYHCTKTQLSLSYILSYDEVSVVIPGIRTPEHAQNNTSGLFRLDEGDRQMIEERGMNEFSGLMDRIKKQG